MKKKVESFMKYWNKPVYVETLTYAKRETAIQFLDKNNEPVATATTWIPGLKKNEVAIKNYSENEGVLETLIRGEIVSAPHRVINGFPICNLI